MEQELRNKDNAISITSNTLYRANGIININFNVTTSTRCKDNYNAIIKYKNNKVSVEEPYEFNQYKDSKLLGSGEVSTYDTPFAVTYPDFN